MRYHEDDGNVHKLKRELRQWAEGRGHVTQGSLVTRQWEGFRSPRSQVRIPVKAP